MTAFQTQAAEQERAAHELDVKKNILLVFESVLKESRSD